MPQKLYTGRGFIGAFGAPVQHNLLFAAGSANATAASDSAAAGKPVAGCERANGDETATTSQTRLRCSQCTAAETD